MNSDRNVDRQRICEAIPHREPFLFVDEILEWTDGRIVCAKTFTGRETFFAGHYPGHPLVPGVLLCEAAMQAGAILLSRPWADVAGRPGDKTGSGSATSHGEAAESGRCEAPVPVVSQARLVPVATRMNDVRFKRMVRPGETIRMEVELTERLAEAFFLRAKVTVDGQVPVRFEFACTASKVDRGGTL